MPIQPGQPQPSFDKQPLRDYLDVERRAGRWNGEAPPPPLPASVVDATSKRYLEAYRRVTGADLKIAVRPRMNDVASDRQPAQMDHRRSCAHVIKILVVLTRRRRLPLTSGVRDKFARGQSIHQFRSEAAPGAQ